ncbi:MAG: TetR/AcrR family transcriptional regulator [Desulfoferrobacter sp.]
MGVAERKQREKEARIKSIKKSAGRLFAKKGFANVSMAEIAAAAEVSKGALYLYFKSKEELYFSLIEPILEQHHKLIAEVIKNEEEPPDETLRKFFNYFADTYPSDPEVHQAYMYFRAEEIQPLFSEERFRQVTRRMAKNVQMVEDVIAEGIRQGIFKPINPRAVSSIVWSLVMGILRWEENRKYGGGRDQLQPTIEAAVSLLVDGLRVCSAEPDRFGHESKEQP